MVSASADISGLRRDVIGRQRSERGIFVFMAVLILVTVLVGFIPDSILMLGAIEAGQRPPISPQLHFHAVLMGAWILLLLTQVGLVATDRRALHRKLGLAAFVLMPAMVIAGFMLVPVVFRGVWALDPAVVPAEALADLKTLISNIALMQIRIGFLFPVLIVWALLVRKSDPATHKRLMILTTLLPLPAAIDRITWLPTTFPESGASADLYILLWAAPLLIHDVLRYGRIPRAFWIWLAVCLPLTIPVHLLWNTPWWLATAPKLMGVESW